VDLFDVYPLLDIADREGLLDLCALHEVDPNETLATAADLNWLADRRDTGCAAI
jgi:hypothetical protein